MNGKKYGLVFGEHQEAIGLNFLNPLQKNPPFVYVVLICGVTFVGRMAYTHKHFLYLPLGWSNAIKLTNKFQKIEKSLDKGKKMCGKALKTRLIFRGRAHEIHS